jgi:epoxyqueuosine reductase
MSRPSIDAAEAQRIKSSILSLAAEAGFSRTRILAPFVPGEPDEERSGGRGWSEGAPSAIAAALPYGNGRASDEPALPGPAARLDAFSRRDYYGEAVARLQGLGGALRSTYGGLRREFRILCNSPVPEKPLAEACGLGRMGRNTLLITPEAGSLVVIAIMTTPYPLPPDPPSGGRDPCGGCAACVEVCPTGALDGCRGERRVLDRSKCIQWYASRPGDVPPEIAAVWGDRLYGCSACRDACPRNARPIRGIETDRGALPGSFDALWLAEASDEELRRIFRGTALGMSWLGPEAIRRNARLAAGAEDLKP